MRARSARALASAASSVLLAAGCAQMSHADFIARRQALSDLEVCEAASDARSQQDGDFIVAVYREKSDRRIGDDRCELLIAEKRQRIAAGIAAFGAALSATAATASGSSYAPAQPRPMASSIDYTWQWDQFFGPDGVLVWACRGEQTGQFAESYRCAGKAQIDWRWPGLTFTR